MTAAGRSPVGGRSIGAVLDALRPDFPDVSISKIRFLESEGLVTPDRTPAGYRQFTLAHLERLRFVLTAQRDHYLPLKVIREQLDALDRGLEPVVRRARGAVAVPLVAAEQFLDPGEQRITREELVVESGLEQDGPPGSGEALLDELLEHGVVRPGPAGFFDVEDVVTVRTAVAMSGFGVQPRHLRTFRSAADREVELLTQLTGAGSRPRGAPGREQSEDAVRELVALSVNLHVAMVRSALRGTRRT